MIRSIRVSVALLTIFVCALSVAIAAPGEKGSWELGVFGGQDLLDDYAGSDPDDDMLLGARLGYFLTPAWSLEASYQQIDSEIDSLGVDFDIYASRLNALYNFRQGQKFRPFLTGGIGYEKTEIGVDDTSDESLNVGGGGRWYFADRFGLRLDARYAYTNVGGLVDDWQGNVETTVGLLFSFGGGSPTDADGDGVNDSRDDCPDTPRGAVVDERGCPKDADGDGVFDGLDKCADTKRGCPVDAKGCPKDTDGDGVIDCDDKCADTAKGCTVDATGCPKDADGDGVCDGVDTCANTTKGCSVDAKGCPKDEDGDGVCDGLDKCAGTAKDCTVDAKGCPADADGDGVCDGVDRCPGTPAGAKVDAKGCELAFDERGALRLEGVNFATNSAVLTPDSTAILDRVAASLNEWSELKVEVGGHTDAQGSDAFNLNLSRRRAESVRNYLVSKGVAAARLTAKGYGESEPTSDNTTEAGRARNRRVELKKQN